MSRLHPADGAALHLLRRCGALERHADGCWYPPGSAAWQGVVCARDDILQSLAAAGLARIEGSRAEPIKRAA